MLSAADKADNNTLSPIFLLQAGEILVKQGKYDDAVNAYTKIKDKYFRLTKQWTSTNTSNKLN